MKGAMIRRLFTYDPVGGRWVKKEEEVIDNCCLDLDHWRAWRKWDKSIGAHGHVHAAPGGMIDSYESYSPDGQSMCSYVRVQYKEGG